MTKNLVDGWLPSVALGLSLLLAQPVMAAEKVNLALDWVVNGTHAGYYVAREKGYYAEAGLDVTVSRGFGSGDTVKRVATGASTFGIADTGTIIAAQANNEVPVRIVGMVFDRATLGIIFLTESGIKKPKDLEGRTLGRSASGASVNMFPGFLKTNSIERTKIREIVVDGANFLPMLLTRKVDAVLEQTVLAWKFKKAALEQGMSVSYMRYADFGLDTYGNAIIANTSLTKDNPDLVKQFSAATMRGFAYAFSHPDEAISILRKANPEVDAEGAVAELKELSDIDTTVQTRARGLGYIDPAKMENTRNIVSSALAVARILPLADIYVPQLSMTAPLAEK
jgi:NitT/TauT family transport system substrate-binding protein